jgi:hypothetical protein
LFFYIATKKKGGKKWVEKKGRRTCESTPVTRPGASQPNAQPWYDFYPDVDTKIATFNGPWTFAGDLDDVMSPYLLGYDPTNEEPSCYGLLIRISTSVEEWDPEHSDYVYMDLYQLGTESVGCVRLSIQQFNAGFSHELDPNIGFYETECKDILNNTLERCKDSYYNVWIKAFGKTINTYWKVSLVVVLSKINSSCDFN